MSLVWRHLVTHIHTTHTAKHTTKPHSRPSLSLVLSLSFSLSLSPSPSPSPSHRAIAMRGGDTIVARPGARDVDDSRITLAVAMPCTG